jgi:ribosome recycling factor
MIKTILTTADDQMKKTIDKLQSDFATLRTGRARATLLENVRVEYYGSTMPLNQIASISTPEARTLEVKPWDKGAIQAIERAIHQSNLGLTPTNDGTLVRLTIPPLTEERRKDLIRVLRKMAEEFRVTIRNERRDALEHLKKAEKSKEINEDDLKKGEQDIQKMTDGYVKKIEDLLSAKERDILEV